MTPPWRLCIEESRSSRALSFEDSRRLHQGGSQIKCHNAHAISISKCELSFYVRGQLFDSAQTGVLRLTAKRQRAPTDRHSRSDWRYEGGALDRRTLRPACYRRRTHADALLMYYDRPVALFDPFPRCRGAAARFRAPGRSRGEPRPAQSPFAAFTKAASSCP